MTQNDESVSTRLSDGFFVGPYRIAGFVEAGDTWDVYLARSSRTHKQVVLKVLRGRAPQGFGQVLSEAAERSTELDHGGIARILDGGDEQGIVYVAEEHIQGPRGRVLSLEQEIHNHGGRLPEDQVRVLSKQILAALDFAHGFRGAGVPHGRLSADKVLLTPQRRIRLIDYGIPMPDAPPTSLDGDVRAMGALMYRMLTGKEASPGCPPPSTLGFSTRWDAIIPPCLAAAPEKAPDLGQVMDRIIGLRDTSPVRRFLA